MSRAEDAAIEARIARLEREARRWRRLAGGALLGLVAIALYFLIAGALRHPRFESN